MYIYINVYGYGYIGYINVYNLSKLYNPTNKYMSYTNKLCGWIFMYITASDTTYQLIQQTNLYIIPSIRYKVVPPQL